MSVQTFNATGGLILLDAEMSGPRGSVSLKLILDTGATRTLIAPSSLLTVGLDPLLATQRASMTTGSGIVMVPLVVLTRLTALGQHRFGMPVVAHALPPGSAVDGLLGLDFLRAFAITIDFPNGRITIA